MIVIPPKLQADFERNLVWKVFWPRCLLALMGTIEIILGGVIFLTEILNILMDFRHANILGGIWASLILFINWILIFVTGINHFCCTTTVRASTCSLVWHMITITTYSILIGFDAAFIMNPNHCILVRSKCTDTSPSFSLHSILKDRGQGSHTSAYESKKYFLRIQLFCACIVLLLSILYVGVFILCRLRLHYFMAKLKSNRMIEMETKRGTIKNNEINLVLSPLK